MPIKPKEIYTTKEARDFLKISESTIKRWLKKGIVKANKIGHQYRILGKELLRLVSPKIETKAKNQYHRLKEKAEKTIKNW